MTYGARLDQAIKLAKKDRAALAAALGVSVQSIGQTITGKTNAHTAENCAKTARFLKVDMYWLATGEGEPRSALPLAEERKALSVEAVKHAMAYDRLSEPQKLTWRTVLLAINTAAHPEAALHSDPSSPKFKTAQDAVKELTDEERLALFTAIQQPGLPDQAVEERIPATKTRKGASGTQIAQFANVQEHKSLIKSHQGERDGSNHVSGNEDEEDGRSAIPLHGAGRKRPGNRSGGGR